ncbi:unnamed protein product [Aphanomyces euteiches]|uniref:C2 Aida-type domain-containing protein n=1 Tax=Aphanomyces euteiches TaxID=100861 RepID=A0A6G0WVD2_9STRA|nr:hypothetical protein Ae201684_011337 [Aphanomyces euteiches]KAH9097476.1 hypothetical protein LEN26_016971 [Aphanomyces euteiches]KAH9100967.1 hypothetical protein Ae201684P_007157 [Aphanomyces euteiches]KAH9126567.1 hypothetical protein AeMF1_003010 [Aphanomyces euteiches]KAH9154464.1 hypothetical protein AeRB84_003451 [Aphanomyces euteiches]
MQSTAKCHRKWVQLLEAAVKADGWGQVIEAVEAYEAAAAAILNDLPQVELGDDARDIVEKTIVTMNLRTTCLSSIDGAQLRPTNDEMQLVLQTFQRVLHHAPCVFPLDLAELATPTWSDAKPTAKSKKSKVAASTTDGVTIFIEKIGLKDADRYIDPQIVVSVVDKTLAVVQDKVETAVAMGRQSPYIFFETSLTLEANLDKLRQNDCTIFFEFVHYKKDKRKKSVRCWTMLEMDEIKPGPLALELYAKPCDVSKRAVHLFTVKPLYLHIELQLKSNATRQSDVVNR